MKPYILNSDLKDVAYLYVSYSDIWEIGKGSLSESRFADLMAERGCIIDGWQKVSFFNNTEHGSGECLIAYLISEGDIFSFGSIIEIANEIIATYKK